MDEGDFGWKRSQFNFKAMIISEWVIIIKTLVITINKTIKKYSLFLFWLYEIFCKMEFESLFTLHIYSQCISLINRKYFEEN